MYDKKYHTLFQKHVFWKIIFLLIALHY